MDETMDYEAWNAVDQFDPFDVQPRPEKRPAANSEDEDDLTQWLIRNHLPLPKRKPSPLELAPAIPAPEKKDKYIETIDLVSPPPLDLNDSIFNESFEM